MYPVKLMWGQAPVKNEGHNTERRNWKQNNHTLFLN